MHMYKVVFSHLLPNHFMSFSFAFGGPSVGSETAAAPAPPAAEAQVVRPDFDAVSTARAMGPPGANLRGVEEASALAFGVSRDDVDVEVGVYGSRRSRRALLPVLTFPPPFHPFCVPLFQRACPHPALPGSSDPE